MADGTRLVRFEAGGKTVNITFLQNWNDNFGDLVLRTTRLPNLSGGFDELGVGSAPSEVGTITANFALVAESKAQMTEQLDELRQMVEWGKGKLYLQPADPAEGERWCWARLNTVTTAHNYERHSDLFMRVQATWQVSYPRWERDAVVGNAPVWGSSGAVWGSGTWGGSGWQHVGNAYHEPPRWGSTGAVWGGGVRWGGAAPTPTEQTVTVNNEGNAVALVRLRMMARVRCPDGVEAERVGSMEHIHVGVTAANESWDVNGRTLSVRKDLKGAYEAFEAATPRWLTLAPGLNQIKFRFPQGGGLNVKIEYNHTWA